jgi:4-carboxymuconolactone decarboxylase
MEPRPTAPRIPPLPPADRTASAQALLDGVTVAGSEANIFTTLVRAEGLTRRWLPFGGRLLNGKLPARDRELLILRTAWNCRAEYEWAQHVVPMLVGHYHMVAMTLNTLGVALDDGLTGFPD